jgi:cytochrome b561
MARLSQETAIVPYSAPARALHWLMAIAIIAGIVIGLLLDDLADGPLKDNLYDIHKSLGVTVLLLAVLRLAWRGIAGAPPEPPLAPHERLISRVVHVLLYVMMFAVPIGGLVAHSVYGAAIPFFWLFEIPPLPFAKNEHLAEQLFTVHKFAAFAFGGLILLHIAGAVMHAIKRDGIMQRMLPAR